MTIPIKSSSEQEAMRQGGTILSKILSEVKAQVKPGVKKIELDKLARRLCLKYHAKPSFLGYNGYPAALCVSLNNEIVHGLPDETVIKEGDLVSLDMGVFYAGFHTDSAVSFICCPSTDARGKKSQGPNSEASKRPDLGDSLRSDLGRYEVAEKMIKVCEQSFYSGIELIKNGVHLGDISAKIQGIVEREGYGVVRMLVGHGVGKEVHEEPAVPNYGEAGTGPILKTGMVIAVEPMITEGHYDVVLSDDKWTYVTKDGSLAAHFEHTVLVTDDGCEILTELK